jgi:hypothetical protein
MPENIKENKTFCISLGADKYEDILGSIFGIQVG